MMEAAKELASVAGISRACQALGAAWAALYRSWKRTSKGLISKRRLDPGWSLSEAESQDVSDVQRSEPFVHRAPAEVYSTFSHESVHLCSARPMHRILEAEGEVRERRNQKAFNTILLGTSLDVQNMGVRALAASLVKLILMNRPEADISIFCGNSAPGIRELDTLGRTVKATIVNFRLSPKANLTEHLFWILLMAICYRIVPFQPLRDRILSVTRSLEVLAQSDFVGDIRGGDSFSDIYGLRRYIIRAIPAAIAILMQKNLVLLPQTYGPYKSKIARYLARVTIMNSHCVYARDSTSIEVVRKLLGKRGKEKPIRFCPDVAFTLDAVLPDAVHIEPPLRRDSAITLVGLNVSGLLYRGGYTGNNMFGLECDYRLLVRQLAEHLLRETETHILLVPHVFDRGIENDFDACLELRRSLPSKYYGRVHMVMREYDQNEIKGIIGLCDFFIGSRMHSCIGAMSQGIPSVGLAYSRKFFGVFESAGVGNMAIDATKKTVEEILTECANHFGNRETVAAVLAKRIPKLRSELHARFREELSDGSIAPRSPEDRSNETVVHGACSQSIPL